MDRLKELFDFILEIDKEKRVTRQTYITDRIRKENDAEHSWHMAVMAILLSAYSNEEIDIQKTVTMLLIHDLVEIDAGDTFAYDEEAKKTKDKRETLAAERIFGLLPEDTENYLKGLWTEFEERSTPESKFAHVMDNIQPMMLNAANKGLSWKEWQVRLSQILKRNEITPEGSRVLWEYARKNFLEPNVKAGNIIDDTKDTL